MWGRRLAKRWNQPFIDLDEEVEKRAGVSITTLFRDHGEAYFRKLEQQTLIELSELQSGFIMATGGGSPCYKDNMKLLRSGISVYLKVRKQTLLGRLRREKNWRPLIAQLDDLELKSFIDRTMEERKKIYEQADVIIEEPGLKMAVLEEKILAQLR